MQRVNKNRTQTPSWRLGASIVAMSAALVAPALAQDSEDDVIVVTGIRKALKDGMDYKRDANGVLDAINAEDIGKFPTSNLAESLQRIPGVSIDRVNGEGSQITVRGFGPGFNQVTLNGRTMPTADVPEVGSGTDGRGELGGDGRAFDFSNLASDGVQALEVYKTGRADVASGGIGATVNVVTRKPLSNPGLQAAFSAKGIVDTTVDRGDDITPEVAGLLSWTNPEETFGLGLSASYARRDSAAPSFTSADWNAFRAGNVLDPSQAIVSPTANITNAPTDPNTIIALPRDSRFHFSEFESERINGQLVAQFAPSEALTLTADYTFSSNENDERRSDFSNWFARPLSDVVFNDAPVPTTVFLREEVTNHGFAAQQTLRSTKDELQSLGFNAEYDLSDTVKVIFDAHTSKAEVTPNAPGDFSRINVGLDYRIPGIISHAVDYSGENPVQIIETATGVVNYDTGLVGSQMGNLRRITQENEIDQFDLRTVWELDDVSTLVFGANYRTQTNLTDDKLFRQTLGNWGAENPGDVDQLAPGALSVFCLSCQFDDHQLGGFTTLGGTPSGELNTFRAPAEVIYAALADAYAAGFNGADPRPLGTLQDAVDEIEEDVLSFFVSFDTEFQVAGRDAYLNVGLRYEDTDVTSTTSSLPTERIEWTNDNDFLRVAAASADGFSSESGYDNFMPNVDFAIDLTSDLKMRASYSQTIARAKYSSLFASDSVSNPPGPGAFGNIATGTKGNPGLLPLESDNFDVSFEWYYGDDSYISIGAFEKRVKNFVGTATTQENLFGLRDASSGVAGSRSGDALAILNDLGSTLSDQNLFALTHYINVSPDLATAQAEFLANADANNDILNSVYLTLETDFDIIPDANDGLFVFNVTSPVNNREAKINGIEIQGQHFFGDTGFGVAGSFTMVDGDVGFDDTGDFNTSQFALTGLSDTANATLIYENYGFSARLAYNWRDEFLNSANDTSAANNPIYTEAYGQLDFSVSYDVNENLSLSFDGINLNEEQTRMFSRSGESMQFLRENGARYFVGARYKF